MMNATSDSSGDSTEAKTDALQLGDFLADERVVIDLDVSSRKRLFEQMAKLVSAHANGVAEASDGASYYGASNDKRNVAPENVVPDVDAVLHALTKREKLGCTGIGNGIALPHGRIDGFAEPVIAVARLKQAINYDAPDGVPVWLAVCLLVPTDANETHLRLLAALAARFNTPGFPEQLKQSRSAAELLAHFKHAQIEKGHVENSHGENSHVEKNRDAP